MLSPTLEGPGLPGPTRPARSRCSVPHGAAYDHRNVPLPGAAGPRGVRVHVGGGVTCAVERDTGGGVRFRASGVLTLHLETGWRPGAVAGYVDTSAYLVGIIGGAADGVTLYEGQGAARISRDPGEPERVVLAVDARVPDGRHVFVVETVVEFDVAGRSVSALVPPFRCSFVV